MKDFSNGYLEKFIFKNWQEFLKNEFAEAITGAIMQLSKERKGPEMNKPWSKNLVNTKKMIIFNTFIINESFRNHICYDSNNIKMHFS